jgi:hypothetical protein
MIHPGNSERGGALKIVLAIIAGLILVCVLAAVVAVWAVHHYVKVEVEQTGDTEKVQIRTPIGELEVSKDDDAAKQLRLPVYPGAEPGDDSGSVRLRGRLWEEEGGLGITAAEFRTEADFDDVDAWYREQLGADFTRQKGRIGGRDDDERDDSRWESIVEPGGDDVIYTRQQEGRVRGVAIGREAGDTTIGLFEITHARRQ